MFVTIVELVVSFARGDFFKDNRQQASANVRQRTSNEQMRRRHLKEEVSYPMRSCSSVTRFAR